MGILEANSKNSKGCRGIVRGGFGLCLCAEFPIKPDSKKDEGAETYRMNTVLTQCTLLELKQFTNKYEVAVILLDICSKIC